MNKIGFACQILDSYGNIFEGTQMRTTTLKYFSTLGETERYSKIEELTWNNLNSLKNQMLWLKDQPEQLRLMRITSDLLPLYTHPISEIYYKPIMKTISEVLIEIGYIVKDNDLIISAHPDQFVILNSFDKDLTYRSIREIEYHFMIFQMMGLSFENNSVINLHGGKRSNGLDQFIVNSKLLPEECRSMISVENDEFSFDIQDILNSSIPEHFKVVLDVHHTWIFTGKYFYSDDTRIRQIKQSWCGKIPKFHISMSPKDLIENMPLNERGLTMAPSYKRGKLRKHSDYIWSDAFKKYALEFLSYGNLMIEAKSKNLAVKSLIC